MRQSQKSNRPRNKNGRKPAGGPSLNRVYESSGPEGKVRGTPQQIVEKYQSLARDKSTAGDRVMAEAFLQHAEHYMRILTAAQPARSEERAEERVQDERSTDDRMQDEPRAEEGRAAEARFEESGEDSDGAIESLAVIGDEDQGGDDRVDLVETPENAGENRRDDESGEGGRRRRRPVRRARAEGDAEDEAAAAPPRTRRRRTPRAAAAPAEPQDSAAAVESGPSEGGDGEPVRAAE